MPARSRARTARWCGSPSCWTVTIASVWPGRRRRGLVVGYALYLAQTNGRHPAVKRLKGDLRGLVEVVTDHTSGTYRAVYTAKLANTIYVLHVFQKKATRGIATPKHELDLIKARLRWAQQHAGNVSEE